ncbi:MAG: hypothetical protein K2W96_01590 [Gemmataceae bacterium]|nr:hypothetical protein [Gemmataceae bacterium]
MSDLSTTQAHGSGRGPDGKFTKGNKGGPGNPHARLMAAARMAIRKAASADDLEAIAQAMIGKAREGDVAAARLVYAYCAGKPTLPPCDPDALDRHELETMKANTGRLEDWAALEGLPAETLAEMAALDAAARQAGLLADLKGDEAMGDDA